MALAHKKRAAKQQQLRLNLQWPLSSLDQLVVSLLCCRLIGIGMGTWTLAGVHTMLSGHLHAP